MLSDEVKELYKKSQDCLNRAQLDGRNSIVKMVDFYDKVCELFNSINFKPQLQVIPDLHKDFANSVDLPLKEYKLTRDKAKDLLAGSRPKLAKMCADYKLSGAGGGQQRDENDSLYGHFDANNCVDGDDRRKFCHSSSDVYLLYWWHCLDEEGFLQFTICTLDCFMQANADKFNLVA